MHLDNCSLDALHQLSQASKLQTLSITGCVFTGAPLDMYALAGYYPDLQWLSLGGKVVSEAAAAHRARVAGGTADAPVRSLDEGAAPALTDAEAPPIKRRRLSSVAGYAATAAPASAPEVSALTVPTSTDAEPRLTRAMARKRAADEAFAEASVAQHRPKGRRAQVAPTEPGNKASGSLAPSTAQPSHVSSATNQHYAGFAALSSLQKLTYLDVPVSEAYCDIKVRTAVWLDTGDILL